MRRIGGFPYDLKNLVFSPDGTRLAATTALNVFVLETQNFTLLFHDDRLADIPNGAAFGPDNTLYIASADSTIRKYSPAGRLIAAKKIEQLGLIYGFGIDPTGQMLAVSSVNVIGAYMLDAATLRVQGMLISNDLPAAPYGALAQSSNGSVASGGLFLKNGIGVVRIWIPGPKPAYRDVQVPNDSVAAISSCGSGFLIATIGQSVTLVDQEGRAQWHIDPSNVSAYGKIGSAFLASEDGRRVWFGLGQGADDPVEFDLTNERLFRSPAPGEGLFPPIDNLLPVTGWNSSGSPKLGRIQLDHEVDEAFRSMAQIPDGSGFVLGSEFQVWRYDRSGKFQWRFKPSAAAYGVNITRSGKLLVAAYGDGTIRWHRLTDGAELLALYVDAKTLAWIAWTPTGYFMSSPGGDNLGGWQLNRGFNAAADFVPMSRFRDRFYRPDIIKLVLASLDEAAAVQAADAATPGGRRPANVVIADQLPPVVTIVSPSDGSPTQPGSVSIGYEVRSPSGLALDSVELLLDGRPTGLHQKLTPLVNAESPVQGKIDVPIPDGTSGPLEIGLVAKAEGKSSLVAKVHLNVAGAPAPDDLLKPKLFALVVGISNYQIPGVQPLRFASKDAMDFQQLLMQQQNGSIYGPVDVHPLTDGQATTGKIKEELDWLNDHVTRHDVGVIYLSGHGQTDARGRFWFLTSDTDKARLAATALSREDIDVTLQSLRGRVIVFLDACHAGQASSGGGDGNVDVNALISDLTVSGQEMVIFSSSTGRELSFESPDWQNGAFTKSVLEAIGEGRADLFKTKRITASLLDAYAVKRVGELTGNRQHPLMFRPQQSADFDIATVH